MLTNVNVTPVNHSWALATISAWKESFQRPPFMNKRLEEGIATVTEPKRPLRWPLPCAKGQNVTSNVNSQEARPEMQRPQSLSKKDNRPETHKHSYLIIQFPLYLHSLWGNTLEEHGMTEGGLFFSFFFYVREQFQAYFVAPSGSSLLSSQLR